jgi:diacylglycerol kinase family enzyme
MAIMNTPLPKLYPFINASSGSNINMERAEWLKASIPADRLGEIMVVGKHDNFSRLQKVCIDKCLANKGILLLSGGDGTVSGFLDLLHRTQLPFALLPSGTFNLFARDNGIPLEAEAALQLALTQPPRPISMGCINDTPFIVSASMGLHTTIIEHREKATRRFGRNRLIAMLSSLWTAFNYIRPFRVTVISNATTRQVTTPMILASLSRSQLEPAGVPCSDDLRDNSLLLFMVKATNWRELLGLLYTGLVHTLENDERAAITETRHTTIEFRRERIKVSLDGELFKMQTPLHIRFIPNALQFIGAAPGSQ